MRFVLIFIIIILPLKNGLSQTPWTYHIWLSLKDPSGNQIDDSYYKENNIKLFSKSTSNEHLTYDESSKRFIFSQTTMGTRNRIIITCGTYVLSISFEAWDFYLIDDVTLPKNGVYCLSAIPNPERTNHFKRDSNNRYLASLIEYSEFEDEIEENEFIHVPLEE